VSLASTKIPRNVLPLQGIKVRVNPPLLLLFPEGVRGIKVRVNPPLLLLFPEGVRGWFNRVG